MNTKFITIKGRLEKAHYELVEALKLANKTAYCCGANIEDLVNEVERSISNTNDHIKNGIDEKDEVKK